MWQTIKKLNEQRGEKLTAMKAILKKGEDEKRDLTADESKSFDTLNTEAEALRAQVERYERMHILEGDINKRQLPGREDIGGSADDQTQSAEYRAEFNRYIRTGEVRASNTITTATGTGAYVPKQVTPIESAAQIPNSLKAAMAFYGRTPFPIQGKVNVSVPVVNLDAGGVVAGNAEAESLATNTDGSLALTPATYESKTQWVDQGIIDALNYDANTSLVPFLTDACERGEEAAFYTASIMTVALKAAARETTTASKVAFADLSAALYDLGAYALPSMKPAFLVSASMLGAMHSMADANGHPVNKLTQVNGIFFWDGTPVFPSAQLEALGDGKFVAAAVSVAALGMAASTPFVIRYSNYPGRANQVGLNLVQYADAKFKSGAIKLLKVKAA